MLNPNSSFFPKLQKFAFYFSVLYSMMLAITNVLYTALVFNLQTSLIFGIAMILSNMIVTIATVYNMTSNHSKQPESNLSWNDIIQSNRKTKWYLVLMIPSLILHWWSSAVSGYGSIYILATHLGLSSFIISPLAITTCIITLLATCSLNMSQTYNILYNLIHPIHLSAQETPQQQRLMVKSPVNIMGHAHYYPPLFMLDKSTSTTDDDLVQVDIFTKS